MQNKSYAQLLAENLDILKEIGNIGMGHASTALAQMLNMKVTMTIPEVYIMTPPEAAEYLKKQSEDSIGVTLNLQGSTAGQILYVLSKSFAVKVINFFFQSEMETISDLDEMSLSVIQEIGNITSGAYCNSLASMTGLFIDISIPAHCPDLVQEVLKTDENGVHTCNDQLLIINNSFFIDSEEVKSSFLFLPDEKTIAMILDKLKEYYGFTA